MSTLWLKFSDDTTLPAHFNDVDKKKLQAVYDLQDAQSVWRRAAALLGFPVLAGRDVLLRWHNDAPYINWSLVVEMVTSGWVALVPKGEGFDHIVHTNLFGLFRLLKSQWKVGQYLAGRLAQGCPLPGTQDEKLVESTALGLALQSIMLRLPAHTPQELASWLASPDSAPQKVRRTVKEIRLIQQRRTLLSPAWLELFPHHLEPAQQKPAPAHFWDEPPGAAPAAPAVAVATQDEWKGLPVCAGQVTGRAVLVKNIASSLSALDPGEFPVLVFPRARPETVKLFPHAAALLFAQGGAMSHACTVAREQGIPCITALGPEFFEQLEHMARQGAQLWIALDGATGAVKVVRK